MWESKRCLQTSFCVSSGSSYVTRQRLFFQNFFCHETWTLLRKRALCPKCKRKRGCRQFPPTILTTHFIFFLGSCPRSPAFYSPLIFFPCYYLPGEAWARSGPDGDQQQRARLLTLHRHRRVSGRVRIEAFPTWIALFLFSRNIFKLPPNLYPKFFPIFYTLIFFK